MQDDFSRSLARVLVYEGGYANNPKDPGGPTNKGITQSTYTSWLGRTNRPSAKVVGISDADVSAIYKTDYWDRILGDELPAGVDFCIFDAAVNSGVSTAIGWAQAVLKTYAGNEALAIDGDLGPATKSDLMNADPGTFVRDFCSHRLGTLQRLKTYPTFGKGWLARIANVQKTAIAWIESGDPTEGPEPVQVGVHGGGSKARIEAVPNNRSQSFGAHITTGALAAGAAVGSLTQGLQPASGAFPWVTTVLAVLAVLGAIVGVVVMVGQKWNDRAAANIAKAVVNTDADVGLPQVPIGKTPLEKAQVPPTPGPVAVSTAGPVGPVVVPPIVPPPVVVVAAPAEVAVDVVKGPASV